MKKRGHTIVPRNPYALAAHQRKAGAHNTLEKRERRDSRRRFKLECAELKKGGDVFSSFSHLPTHAVTARVTF